MHDPGKLNPGSVSPLTRGAENTAATPCDAYRMWLTGVAEMTR